MLDQFLYPQKPIILLQNIVSRKKKSPIFLSIS